MFCGNCGNELREGAKFCPKCGAMTRLARQQEQPPAEPERAIPPIPEPDPVLETEPVQEPAGTNTPAEPAIEEDAAPAPRQQVRQRPAAGKAKPAVRLKAMPVKPAQEAQSTQQVKPAKPVSPPPAPEAVEPPQQPAAPAQPSFLETGAARLASAVGSVKDALGGGSVQCGSCGIKLKAGTKFCPECGAFQGEINQEGTKNAQTPTAENVKTVAKRISIVAVPVVAIALVLVIAVTVGRHSDNDVSPTATPFSDTTSNSNGLSTPTAMPTKEPSFTPPNGLPEGEIWNHVIRTDSIGRISFEPYHIIPAYQCTQEVLDATLAEISENYTPNELYEFFYTLNKDYNVIDSADVFSAEGVATLYVYASAMHNLWDVDVTILTLESANGYSESSHTIQINYGGRIAYDWGADGADVLFILGESDNTYVVKKNIPPAISYVVDGERISKTPYLADEYFQIIQTTLSQPSFTVGSSEKTMIELYSNLIRWLATNRPMKDPVFLGEIPVGQWVEADIYDNELSITPYEQIYINSVDENTITFTPTVTIRSEIAAHNGETYTLETPIKAECTQSDWTDQWGNQTDLRWVFTYTDPWGNVFEGSLRWNGAYMNIQSDLVTYGPENQFTFGASGRFYPVKSIFD